MRIAIVRNWKELAERAFVEIRKVLAEKPDAVIGFATGATPVPLYEKMADDHKKNGTSYKRVRAFNLDEYVGVDKNDKASFARFMRDNLFSKIDIDPANTDIPNGMAEDLSAECERYSAMVKANPADIQILGIGENGHIAFNEPYTKPEEPTHISLLTASTRAANAGAFKDPSLVPQYALTMGIDEILTAKRILLLATGERKAQAVYDMIMGRDDTSCPAAALRKHPDVTVVLDKEAASLLAQSARIPAELSSALHQINKGRLKVNLEVMDSFQPLSLIDKMVNKLIVCIVAAALLIGSSLICTTEMTPRIFGIPALGFMGYIAAVLLGVWMLFHTHVKR